MTDESIDHTIQKMYQEAYGKLEREILSLPQAIVPSEHSVPRNCPLGDEPPNFSQLPDDIFQRFLSEVFPNIRRCTEARKYGIISLRHNPGEPEKTAAEDVVDALRREARDQGVDRIGFTTVPRHLIFSDCAIVYPNVIMLAKRMDDGRLGRSPGIDGLTTTFETYASLGEAANHLADFLRRAGFGAAAGMSLGGAAFYPELAERAGMGARGRNGLLISDGAGPAQRLACVYTSIENLPQVEDNPHQWVQRFCARCLNCVRLCPVGALHHSPPRKVPGGHIYVDADKCRPYFEENQGCGLCIVECPFFRREYSVLKERAHRYLLSDR